MRITLIVRARAHALLVYHSIYHVVIKEIITEILKEQSSNHQRCSKVAMEKFATCLLI